MKAVIFAGGVGTRLWPLSRKKSPKQFERIVGDKSTLQLAVDRLLPEFSPSDIYISTGDTYIDLVKTQLNMIPSDNIAGEPEKKDVGPAVAYMMACLAKDFPDEPVIILWSDHMVKHEDKFKKILKAADKLIRREKEKIVFIGQQPRFASDNLGWLEMGETSLTEDGVEFKKFLGCKYKPSKELAQEYFSDKKHCWNLGYFVSTPRFITDLYKRYAPEIYKLTQEICKAKDTIQFEAIFKEKYHQMPSINFDNAVLEQLDKDCAYVVVDDIGWSDVGAWEALKEALEKVKEDNIVKGKVLLEDTTDTLAYNYELNKLVVGIDLEELLIVNTDDVLLVAKKTSVPKIKKLVESFQGTEHENLT